MIQIVIRTSRHEQIRRQPDRGPVASFRARKGQIDHDGAVAVDFDDGETSGVGDAGAVEGQRLRVLGEGEDGGGAVSIGRQGKGG